MSIPTPSPAFYLTLHEIIVNGHKDLEISRWSYYRFVLPSGFDPYLTKYSCEDGIVDDLKDPTAGRKRPFGPYYLSTKNAAQTLCSAHHAPILNMSPERRQALQRLHALKSDPGNDIFWSDIAFKIFNDLDIGLFEGRLTGNVCLGWYLQPDVVEPVMTAAGQTRPYLSRIPGVPDDALRLVIVLNGVRLLLDTRSSIEKIVEALVHEMLHAYLHLVTNTAEDHGAHGPWFQKCLKAVDGTLQQYTGFYTNLLSKWTPHGQCGVTCPTCATAFTVQM